MPVKVFLIYSGMTALNPKHRMAVNENRTTLFFMHFPFIPPLRTREVLSSHFSGDDLKHRESKLPPCSQKESLIHSQGLNSALTSAKHIPCLGDRSSSQTY